MKTNRDRAAEFRALAADLEDVTLRMRGHAEDTETVMTVANTLLAIADDFDGGETPDEEE